MTNPALYPLQFQPIFKEKIWGGNKMRRLLNKHYGHLENCGESWEISGVDGDISVVSDGPLMGESLADLIDKFQSDLVGYSVYQKFGNQFPLLVKFIDADDDLSIQVHPSDEIALKRHDCFGKTEMWYIIENDPEAKLYCGFSECVAKEDFREYCQSAKVLDVLNKETVKPDDVFFLPPGRIHSIGKGILLAEIQQTSDVTYRIYDFDRVDGLGNKRDLHIEQALDVIDYDVNDGYKTAYQIELNEATSIVKCQYFTTNILSIDHEINRNFDDLDSFKIYMCLDGQVQLKCDDSVVELIVGSSVLVPACFKSISFLPKKSAKILETYISQ